MKNRKAWLIIGALSFLIGAGCYMLSPRRDLEHCFGLRSLPSSIRNETIMVDAWTDYVVHAAFEIDPEDFPKLMSRMDYKKEEFWSDRIARFREFDDRFGKFGDEIISEVYVWHGPNDSRSRFVVNNDRNKVLVIYSAD